MRKTPRFTATSHTVAIKETPMFQKFLGMGVIGYLPGNRIARASR